MIEHFRITYDGPALASHQMEARELAPALLAISDLLESANRVLNGKKAEVKVNVNGSFKTGSFWIDFGLVQTFISQLSELFTSKEASAFANAAQILGFLGLVATGSYKGLLHVIKWLRNRKISTIRQIDDDRFSIEVENDKLEIESNVLALLQDYQTRQALEGVVYKPLQNPGIEIFSTGTDISISATITKNEALYFAVPSVPDEEIEDSEFETTVQIARIEFNEENKWRFTDGMTTFYAPILDEQFLSRIDKNEASFSKGDLLKVRVHKRQWTSISGIKAQYEIIKVLEHKSGARQIKLPFAEEPGTGHPPA